MKVLRLLPIFAVAAFAVASPTSASAAVWKHGTTNVGKSIELNLSGGEAFGAIGVTGAMTCEVSARLTTTGGSTATITSYTLFGCNGTGDLSTCVALVTEAKGLPWTVDVNASDLTLTKMRIVRTFAGKGCPLPETDVTWNPTLTLSSPAAIFEMEFFVQGALFVSAGLLQVTPPNAGTYGIG